MKMISVYPSSISVISKKFNKENFYENKYLPIGNTKGADGNVFRTLMSFDIREKISRNAKIKSAKLNLYVEKNIYTHCTLNSNEVYINYNTEAYNSLGVNWDNAPNFIYLGQKASIKGNRTEYFITIDLIDESNKWTDYYKDNYGITLTGIENMNNSISIFSYDHNRRKPYITLEIED